MLPKGCVQANGSLLVTSSDPTGTATENIFYTNGLPVNNLGQLQVSYEPIVSYAMGLPFDADGKLVVQDVADEGTGDSYVGGLRVGTDGIHIDYSDDEATADFFVGGIRVTEFGAVYATGLYYLPGEFDAKWIINDATPEQVYTRTIWLTIIGAGAISVTGTSEWSDDGTTFTADPGTITTGKLWVRDTAGAYEAVVNGGVVIDTVACPMVITSMAEEVGALKSDGTAALKSDGTGANTSAQ